MVTPLSRKLVLAGFLIVALAASAMFSGVLFSGRPDGSIPQVSAANVDYFLKLEGIDGESTDDKHKGEIDVESWSWGVTNPGSHSGGGGGGAGKAVPEDLQIVKGIDKATPKLFEACAAGKHIKSAELSVRKAGKDQEDYLKYKFEDLMCTSDRHTGAQSGDPIEAVSFTYGKVTVEYKQQSEKGQLGAPIIGGFDFRSNKEL